MTQRSKREWGGPLPALTELDEAPASWRRWWRWRDRDGWTLHVRETAADKRAMVGR